MVGKSVTEWQLLSLNIDSQAPVCVFGALRLKRFHFVAFLHDGITIVWDHAEQLAF